MKLEEMVAEGGQIRKQFELEREKNQKVQLWKDSVTEAEAKNS